MSQIEKRVSYIVNKYSDRIVERFNDKQIIDNIPNNINENDIVQSIVGYFTEIDCTKNKKYIQWMTKIYIKGEKLEDYYKLEEYLPKFIQVSSKIESSDINQFNKISEFLKVVSQFDEKEVLSKREIDKMKKLEGAEYIFNEPNFKIIWTKTHEANMLYGANTQWCTTSKNDKSTFENYNKQGPLYIILATLPDGKVRKFQFHYESDQFMDEHDGNVAGSDVDLLSSYPSYKDFLNMMIDKHYKKYL